MSKWINEYTCPGYMYEPRKPWKFGNEYHDAGCALSGVIWQVNLHECFGKDIIAHFTDKPIGAADAIKGELDGMPFYIFGMKESDYVMQIMSTYGMLAMMGEEKHHHVMVSGTKQVITFKYLEVVHNHYWYRDVIDNHNLQQMHPISMEETWMTTRWPNRIFCLLLAVTMVNVQNAGVYFCSFPKVDSLTAHKLIAQQLIENRYLIVEQSSPRKWP